MKLGTQTTDRITFLTQLTAAYVRGRVASHYQENETDQKEVLFLTLGLGTENNSAATDTLYPAGSNEDLVKYWNNYLAGTAGRNVTAITGDDSLTVRCEADVEAMNYVDTYYYANDAQGLINSFVEIVNEIELKAESYATLVENGNADFSGYVTFDDQLGELMKAKRSSPVKMEKMTWCSETPTTMLSRKRMCSCPAIPPLASTARLNQVILIEIL